jgi:hypothetical protein
VKYILNAEKHRAKLSLDKDRSIVEKPRIHLAFKIKFRSKLENIFVFLFLIYKTESKEEIDWFLNEWLL